MEQKIVSTAYAPLQPPYQIIKYDHDVAMQIGTLIVTVQKGGKEYQIETHSHPVVAYENKNGKELTNEPQAPLKNWLDKAGITKHITYHCSRHTLGSLQVEAGTSVYTVQHILGHKNVATTQIYAAMADESKRESVDKITLKSAKIAQMKVG